jgi:hypothetical protein
MIMNIAYFDQQKDEFVLKPKHIKSQFESR